MALLLFKVFILTFIIGLACFCVGLAIVDYYERKMK